MKSNNFHFVFTIILFYGINIIGSEPHISNYGPNQEENSWKSVSANWANARNRFRDSANRFKRQSSSKPENICDSLCTCTSQHFPSVNCSLLESKRYTLDGRYFIQAEALSLTIKLGIKTNLVLKPELFKKNILNRIYIEGNQNGMEQVEVSEKSFFGNNGSNTEIEFYNCHTIIFGNSSFYQESILNVTSSKEVNIFPKAFSASKCRIYLTDIQDLRIHERAFETSSETKIEITKCFLESIRELKASFKQFKIVDSTIKVISSKAFDVNTIDSLIFDRCKIDVIESQATTEKFLCKYFAMTDCSVKEMREGFIPGSGILNFTLKGNRIEKIAENAIKFTGISSNIANNKIISVGSNWLTLQNGWNDVTIFNNTFGDFNYMTVSSTSAANPVCTFQNNFITNPAPRSLDFINTVCNIKEISFHTLCTCDIGWLRNLGYKNNDELFRESHCQIKETLKYCLNATILNVKQYLEQVCSENTKSIDCLKNQNGKKIQGEFISPEEIESNRNRLNTIYIVIIACASLVLVILLIFVVIKLFFKSEISHIPNDMSSISSFNISDKTLKTFSKEDRLIINQTLEKIKEKQLSEKYDQIYSNTRKLLNGNFTETEKVLTIGEIVRCLGECENSGEDFVAFTDILYKHLAPTDNTVHESEYAEASTVPHSNDGQTNVNDYSIALDHIYAEPSCAQQPLLINEYSAPLDVNDSLYSEPIQVKNKDNSRTLITPYAIGSSCLSTNQQPSTSKNLPDILNSNKSNPKQFQHINKSPRSNRDIPEYTLPNKKQQPSFRGATNTQQQSDSSSSNSNSNSEHSGGSDITMKIDDIVEYADA